MLLALRWPLIVLYCLVVAGLVATALASGDLTATITVLLGLLCQLLFFISRGNPQSLVPVTYRRVLLPSIIGGLMMAVLLVGMLLALIELLRLDYLPELVALSLLLLSWLVWTVVFLVAARNLPYLRAVRRLVLTMLGGSLLQLLTTLPSHLIVTRRGGCLVGIATGIGLMAGVSVLFWAFGPGIVLLFMYEQRKRRRGHCPECGYSLRGLPEPRCPECGRPFTSREVGMTLEQLGCGQPSTER